MTGPGADDADGDDDGSGGGGTGQRVGKHRGQPVWRDTSGKGQKQAQVARRPLYPRRLKARQGGTQRLCARHASNSASFDAWSCAARA